MTRLGKGVGGRPFEREYDATIIGMAHAYGWLAHHNTDSRREIGDAGFPDWVFAHPCGAMFMVETKVKGGRQSDGQKQWAECLGSQRVRLLWLPDELDELERVLKGLPNA